MTMTGIPRSSVPSVPPELSISSTWSRTHFCVLGSYSPVSGMECSQSPAKPDGRDGAARVEDVGMRPPRIVLAAAAVAAVCAPVAIGTSSAATPASYSYTTYDLGMTGGEPSIGYDRKADAAVYGSGTKSKRLTWNDAKKP